MTISEEKESPQKKIEKLENIVKECEQKLSEEIRDEGERELENTKLSALHDLEYLYEEIKEAVVSRRMSGEEMISDIGRDTGININTLYRWRDAAQKKGLSATTKYKNADKWSSQDKFTVVLETANLS